MTDKQIIIDDQKKTIHRLQDECTEKTNAIIALGEQFKAKEQECEELKKIINEAKNSKLDLNSFFAIEATIGEYCLELDRLKAKNDELMKQHQADKGLITSTGKQNYQLLQEYDKLKTDYKQLEITCEDFKKCINKQRNAKIQLSKLKDRQYKEFCNMKQVLNEIKEIAESEMDSKEFMAVQRMLNGSVDNKNKVLKQILQKISEVEDE